MKIIAALTAVMLLNAASPALASVHVIASLGSAPLLGKTKTAPALRRSIAQHHERLKAAASELGVEPAEYVQVEQRFMAEPTWVVVPRHLDGMAWYKDGKTRVLHDVIIPTETYGWEVELNEGDQVLDVYMPASCGNLSIIRKFRPRVAHLKPAPSGVAASAEHAPSAAPPPSIAAGPGPAPAAQPGAPTAPGQAPGAPTSTTPTVEAIPPASGGGHFRFLPWLAALGLGLLIGGGGGGNQQAAAPPVAPTPPPCKPGCKCKP